MKSALITSSILILLLAALRPVLRGRIDPRMQYALWLVVVLRLLLPVELAPSAYSVLALLERAEAPVAQVVGNAPMPVPAMSYEDAFDQALREYGQERPAAGSAGLDRVEARARELTEHSPTLAELFAKYACPVWLGGAVLAGLWFLLINFRLRRRLKGARRLEGMDCPLPVFVSDALPSPCLCGTLRPRIYVTPAALENPDRLRYVLAHELTHYRHRDHWWAPVRCLCLCAYWFDPLVWWAAALSRQDCELACDEGTIRRLGEGERIPYGRTLVDMIAAGRTPLLQTATTMTGGKRRMRERIRFIARRPRTVLAVALALVVVLGAAVGCTFTGVPEEGTAGTLWQRLSDLPEDLRATVEASPYDADADSVPMVSYWWDVPAQWKSERYPWLLSVILWQRDDSGTAGWPETSGSVDEPIAQDEEFYYVIERPENTRFEQEDAEPFTAAYEAARAFAEKTLLETEGLEPYASKPRDTLQTRLLELPGALDLPPVDARPGGGQDPDCLAAYWLSDPKWADQWSGYLMNLYLCPLDKIEENVSRGLWSYNGAGLETFARSGDLYYSIVGPGDGRYEGEDEYWDTFYAIRTYIKAQVWETEGVEQFVLHPPETAQDQLTAMVGRILSAPSVEYTLDPNGTGRVRTHSVENDPGESNQVLADLISYFRWESASCDPVPDGISTLRVSASDGSATLLLRNGSGLVVAGNGNCWEGTYLGYGVLDPFSLLRSMFDRLELDSLRSTTVPDRGQSHEDVVREWVEGYEGAYLQCTPGSRYACTYLEVVDVDAGLPNLEGEALAEFIQRFGYEPSEFQKTWFAFCYRIVFVPAYQSTGSTFWVGNTLYYEGDGAPAGALTYSRVGIMERTGGGWYCQGTGTGW